MSDSDDAPLHFGNEPPIVALATVVQARSETIYQLSLPNGKLTHGHVPRRLADVLLPLETGESVRVEISPYDFGRARITAKAPE
ncbi:MAG: hypothetical protein KDN22_33985 [Verrucomicrobiae bacterium]|nr:hypothetical protein [Verrucomicrobiae bacterium]